MPSETQKAGIRKTLTLLLGFIVLMVGVIMANYLYRDVSMTPEQAAKLGFIRFETPRPIQLSELVLANGEPIKADYFLGNWNLLYFGFTACPDICPTTLALLNQASEQYQGEQPSIHLVSVDPEQDTPKQLARYLAGFNPAFNGLTGSHEAITRFATQVNVAFGKIPGAEPGTYTVDHTGSIVVIDPQGRYAGFIKAPHQTAQLMQVFAGL